MLEKYDVAIIGCGAATVSFLKSFLFHFQRVPVHRCRQINIVIFEKSTILGGGSVYQRDLKNLLINRPLGSMSANAEDSLEFEKWLLERDRYHSEIIIEADEFGDKRAYTSRTLFGYYLNWALLDAVKKLKDNFVNIEFINHEVVDVKPAGAYFAVESKGGFF